MTRTFFYRFAALTGTTLFITLAAVLFVPPIRHKFFTTNLWPWRLPWDTNLAELQMLEAISRPGDVLIESNLHGWQWVLLSLFGTGTSWVHAALVDDRKQLLTVHKIATEVDWGIYLEWGSTRLALIRPPYRNDQQAQAAIDYARSKLGTIYDPSFRENAGNCNGLVATALRHSGIDIQARNCWGREIYPADTFVKVAGARVIWSTEDRSTKQQKSSN